jgi:hypothetical protein
MQVQAMGIVWYRREDYQRCKAMFTDGSKLADTFDEWLAGAQKGYDKFTSEGMMVEKAYIDPDTFPQWCRTHHQEMNSQGRNAYANECAARKFRADVQ